MYVCMCVCMYVCIYVCMYIYIHTHTHTHTHIYIYIYIYIPTHVCIYAGKAPVTWGGKILLISHWLFVTIVAATYTGIGFWLSGLGLDTCIPISICISISLSYTGAVGAFLATWSDAPIVEGHHFTTYFTHTQGQWGPFWHFRRMLIL